MKGFLVLFFLGLSSVSAVSIYPDDHLALLKLRSNFGVSSRYLPSWTGSDCTKMQHVTCTADGFLSAINLSASATVPSLKGPIGDSIGSFSHLQSITMRNLSIVGALPSTLCNLKELVTLDLGNNQMNGSVPSCFENLTKLSHLNLENNFIGGSLSDFLCQLTKVEYLNLGKNVPLTGNIPSCVGNMTNLRQLLLQKTGLIGSIPGDLCRLTSLDQLIIEAKLEGTIPTCLGNLRNLTALSFAVNNLEGTIPAEFCNMTSIKTMVLERNRLSGSIPSCLSKIQNLTKLAVGTNFLTGPVPQNFTLFYAQVFVDENYLSGSPELTFVSAPPTCLSAYFHNCFDDVGNCTATSPMELQRPAADCAAFCNATSPVGPCGGHGRCTFNNSEPVCACNAGFVGSTISGAAATCVRAPPPPPPVPPSPPGSSSSSGGGSSTGIIAGVLVGLLCGLVVLCCIGVCCWRKRRRQQDEMKAHLNGAMNRGQLMQKLEEQNVRHIRLDDIRAATDDFSEEKLLGRGGYGSVYLGDLDGSHEWAVKRATVASKETLAVFEDEVVLISKINHRNLVQLLGFCTEGDEQILVYEYVPCGTLQDRLQPPPGTTVAPLSFSQRLDVAVGVARGLNYLHSFSQKPIVHRDIKSANILLDEDSQPKIADFGLSKVLTTRMSSFSAVYDVASTIAGTFGYMDPELQRNLEVTPKLDVFSFGVVLLELLTGKPALIKDPSTHEPTTLYKWATPYINIDNVERIVDPYLLDSTPMEALKHFAALARLCLLRPASDRPSMAHVTLTLEGARGHTYVEPSTLNRRQESQSGYFDHRPMLGSTSSFSGKTSMSSLGPR